MKYMETLANIVAFFKVKQQQLLLYDAFSLEKSIESIYEQYWDNPIFHQYILDYMEVYTHGYC